MQRISFSRNYSTDSSAVRDYFRTIYKDFSSEHFTDYRRHAGSCSVKISARFMHGNISYKIGQSISFCCNHCTDSTASEIIFGRSTKSLALRILQFVLYMQVQVVSKLQPIWCTVKLYEKSCKAEQVHDNKVCVQYYCYD